MGSQNLVYVIDDDESIRSAIDMLLTVEGFDVETYASAVDFLSAGLPREKGCILTDLQMPGGLTGIDVLRKIGKRDLGWPVIIMTSAATQEVRETASRSGAFDFLEKPFGPDALIDAVRNAVETLNVA
jgi:FixJ family two-component response regulator